MAESSLTIKLDSIKSEIGDFLGIGRAPGNWSAADISRVDAIIRDGLLQFYFPERIGGFTAHRWSFLEPIRTLVLAADQDKYNAPDDMAHVVGMMTYKSSEHRSVHITKTSDQWIRQRQQRSLSLTGTPTHYALVPRDEKPKSGRGQRFCFIFYPTPDRMLEVEYRIAILPEALTDDKPYPYGGASFGHVIQESCLAIAELRYRDELGIHNQVFRQMLTSAIDSDTKQSAADDYGYNRDESDRAIYGGLQNCRADGLTSYNGVIYGDLG